MTPANRNRFSRVGRVAAIVVMLVGSVGATAIWAGRMYSRDTAPAAAPSSTRENEPADRLTRFGDNGIAVPPPIADRMGLRTAAVAENTRRISLPPLHGCLALNNNSLWRLHSRFAGEVVSIDGEPAGPESPATSASQASRPRPWKVGDRVKAGDLLAVVWSKDLGEKKSELIDAISKLRLDERIFSTLHDAFRAGSVPERSWREAERNVESDRIAVDRAERTLRSWRLTDDEIAAIRREADQLSELGSKRPDPARWARVSVLAPHDGVILEKNVAVGDIVDTSTDLYKIGDLSELAIWVHVYEEDLPILQALPQPMPCAIVTANRADAAHYGVLESIAPMIDPNQHTALVTGRIQNPDGLLKIGQFVTVSLTLAVPPDELELPVDAVVEDGRESVVFVQSAAAGNHFVRTPVQVTRRFRDGICVRSGGGVKRGDRLVTAGSLLLKDAMEDLPAPKPTGGAAADSSVRKNGTDGADAAQSQ